MHTRLHALLVALALLPHAASAQTQAPDPVFAPDPARPGSYVASETVLHRVSGTFAEHFDIVPPIPGFLVVTLDSDLPVGSSGAVFQGFEITGPAVEQQLRLFPDLPSHVTFGPIEIGAPADLIVGVVAAPALVPRTPASASYTAVFHLAPVPEPGTWLLVGAGLLVLAARRRTARSSARASPA